MRRLLGSALVPLVAALTIAACTDASAPSGSRSLLEGKSADNLTVFDLEQAASNERAAAEALPAQYRDIEHDFLRLEAQLPGFGGLYLDSTGVLVVRAPADSDGEVVRSALSAHSNMLNIEPDLQRQLKQRERVRIVSAQYPFSHLRVWKAALARHRAPGDGIVMLDANEATNQVFAEVVDSSTIAHVLELAANEGIPPTAIHVELGGYPAAITAVSSFVPSDASLWSDNSRRPDATPLPSGHLQQRVNVKVGGVQIMTAGYKECSIGFFVLGDFVTASHCAPGTPGNGGLGPIYQASPSDPLGWYGGIYNNRVWNVSNVNCGIYHRCTHADAMHVQNGTGWPVQKSVARPGGPNMFSYSIASPIQMNVTAIVGNSVKRVGRSTGEVNGSVIHTCSDMTDTTFATPRIVLCSVKVNGGPSPSGGDSGGPVFQDYVAGTVNAYGIAFASRTPNDGVGYYYSPISAIQFWLNISVN